MEVASPPGRPARLERKSGNAPASRRRRFTVLGAFHWVKDLYVCMDRTRTFGLAAQTAFWLFLSLIPLAAVAGLAAARVSANNWDRLNPLLRSLPGATRE